MVLTSIAPALKLTLVRGLPGSGKTTLAKTKAALHIETDMFFQKKGLYNFDSSKIKEAHEWCQAETKKCLELGISMVVSNTFVKVWEMQFYIDLAKEIGCEFEVLTATGNFKNIHEVPDEVIERMKQNWETYPIVV